MSVKTHLTHLALTTLAATLTWMVSAGALQAAAGIDLPPNDPEELLSPIGGLLMVVSVLVALGTWIPHRSQYQGRRLAAQVFSVLFGVMFFMTQVETLAFNDAIEMPWQVTASTMASGFLVCLVVAAGSVRLRRKLGPPPTAGPPAALGRGALVGRFGALAALYTVLYFLVGYYIAWQFPVLRGFYSGSSELVPFPEHMSNVLAEDGWLVPLQFLRGCAWAALAWLLVTGLPPVGRLERYMLVGLALSLPLAAPLLVPQGYMPMAVRIAHSSELLIENFLFGCAALAVLQARQI